MSPEDRSHQLQVVGLLSWLIKDLAWVLLLPEVSFPAAFLALCLETHSAWARWTRDSTAGFVHSLALLAWLLGNSIWMAAELLFEASPEPGRRFPWYRGPLLGVQPGPHQMLLGITQGLFALGVAMLAVLYAKGAADLFRQQTQPVEAREHSVAESAADKASGRRSAVVAGIAISQNVYEDIFVGPWILKDFFWITETLTCALPFALLAALLTLDSFRRFRGEVHIAEFIWVLANILWIVAELGLKDASQWPRWTAGAILMADSLLVTGALWRSSQCKRAEEGGAYEDSYLFGSGRPSRSLHD